MQPLPCGICGLDAANNEQTVVAVADAAQVQLLHYDSCCIVQTGSDVQSNQVDVLGYCETA